MRLQLLSVPVAGIGFLGRGRAARLLSLGRAAVHGVQRLGDGVQSAAEHGGAPFGSVSHEGTRLLGRLRQT